MVASKVLLGFGAMTASAWAATPRIHYEIAMPEPHTHYYHVKLEIEGLRKKHIDVGMPVWTPGSYKVREFAKNVVGFSAMDGDGRPLEWQKIRKNQWRVHARKQRKILINYRVYAHEVSVRHSYLDDGHGFVMPAGVTMYVKDHLRRPITLRVVPYPSWGRISTGLDRVGGDSALFYAPDYDTLVDCPLEIGNHAVHTFEVDGIPHHLAIYGDADYDVQQLVDETRKVVETTRDIFGSLPYPHYTFIIHLLQQGRGGLEHANSTCLHVRRASFFSNNSYSNFMGLVAHEFFHTWNVKRIRPIELGPFDYDNENHTTLLWVAEGITSYYQHLILLRAGLKEPDDYLDGIANNINSYFQRPGRLFQSLSEASYDAWIKYYNPDENSFNTTVSYYGGGALIGMLLDLEIRHRTAGEKSLDDVMRALYAEFYLKRGRGFTEKELRRILAEVAGRPLDEIIDRHVNGTEVIDFARYLDLAGLELRPEEDEDDPPGAFLGLDVRDRGGKATATQVLYDTQAQHAGLSVGDQLHALDGKKLTAKNFGDQIRAHAPGDTVRITYSRDGRLRELDVVLGEKLHPEYSVERVDEPTELQRKVYESWVGEWAGEEEVSEPASSGSSGR